MPLREYKKGKGKLWIETQTDAANSEELARYEREVASGEEKLEKIQEEMYGELDDLIQEFLANIEFIAKRDDYDLKDDAMTYVKDQI